MDPSWHADNPMPGGATLEERVQWHREHARECGCRRPPADIAAILRSDAVEAVKLSPSSRSADRDTPPSPTAG